MWITKYAQYIIILFNMLYVQQTYGIYIVVSPTKVAIEQITKGPPDPKQAPKLAPVFPQWLGHERKKSHRDERGYLSPQPLSVGCPEPLDEHQCK